MMFLSALALFFCLGTFAAVIEAPALLIDFAQNPTSIVWKKIDSEHFEVIFDEKVESEAQRVTHLLEKMYPFVSRSLDVKPAKISLILQNQSTVSNGFVTLAPRRTEWYMTPATEPGLSNTEWLKTLAIHEFRHVVQFQKSRQNFNKYFEYFLGEYGQALGLGLSFPPWFLEGDAVGVETALSRGGRGRLPIFDRDLRTLLLAGKDYDYDQAHLGSYENYIPNHYLYGYFYTSYMRNRHGDMFLSKLGNESTDRSYNPLTFYNSYERLTDETFEEFYKSTMKDLIKLWKEKLALFEPTPYEVKNLPQKSGWTNYLYPQGVGEGKFFALKKGLSHYDRFVLTDGKIEKTILYPGILQSEYPYKLRNGRFAYVEVELDPRWGYRDYSRIKVWDLKKKKQVFDLKHTKARLATLDFSGKLVLYVSWDEKQGQYVVVTDLNGKEVYRLKYPSDRVITSLDWLGHDRVVMVVKGREDQKEIVQLSLLDQMEEVILPPTYVNLGYVTTQDDRILFESPVSGIDNIYAIFGGFVRQLTNSRHGAYAPTVWNNELVYNDYSVDGMNIVAKKLPWDERQESGDSFVAVYEKFAANENRDQLERDFFEQKTYPVAPYSQLKNAVNLHSWLILAPPLSSTVTLMGISRDIMNKFSLTAGGIWDLNERTSQAFVASSWSHYYPVFDLRAAYGGRRNDIKMGTTEVENKWEEGTVEAGLQIPYKNISGRFVHLFSARAFSKIIKVTNKLSSDFNQVRDGALLSPGAQLSYQAVSRMAKRDLNPEWGFSLLSHYEKGKDFTGTNQEGRLLALDSKYFFPGFKSHHSFFHQLAYEKQEDETYQYPSFVFKPRGTTNFFLEEFRKYSLNYMAPLFYPDWHWSRYLYVKRIYANVFYDELNGRFRNFSYKAASTGWEVLTEFNVFRIFIPLTIGIRNSYVLRGVERSSSFDIFFNSLTGSF